MGDVVDLKSDDIIEEQADSSVNVIEEDEKSEGLDCNEMDEDSSIELSDSEYDDVINVKPIVITPLRDETVLPSAGEESTDEVLCEPDFLQRDDSKDAPIEDIKTTQPEEVETEVQAETVPILKIKKPLKQEKKKKNPIKLVIKPIKQDAVDNAVDNDVDLSGCISESEAETKNPPIIVKIPKASLSPSKKGPKSPFKPDSKLSKTPAVTIKNLKILPFFQPKPTPDSTTSKHEKPEQSAAKENKKKSEDRSADIHSKSGRLSSSEKTEKKVSKSSFTVTSNKNRDSKVTVLKMSGRSALSRKEEAREMNERKSDLERMLEDERKRKSEEVKKMKETKKEVPPSPVAKKSPARVMK